MAEKVQDATPARQENTTVSLRVDISGALNDAIARYHGAKIAKGHLPNYSDSVRDVLIHGVEALGFPVEG